MFTVLLPLDTNENRAIAAVNAITSIPEASENVEVTILNVKGKLEVQSDSIVKSEDWYDEQDYPSSVNTAITMLESEDIPVKKRREHAEPADTIVKTAKELGVDRIVMAGRKKSPTGKAIFGSVTQTVLLNSEIPVTVVMTK